MTIEGLFAQAAALQRGGDLAGAEAVYRQILATAPSPEALVNHANILARLGRREEALAQYGAALAARPDFFEALFNRANLYLEMKRHDAALVGFDAALKLRGDVAGAWNNRGTALRGLNRLDDALASYDRAVALSPGHAGAHTNRALTLGELRRFDEGLAAAQAALKAQPGFAEALYVKAGLLRDSGRLEDAVAAYEQTLAANPAHPFALSGLAQAALGLCDWERTAALAPRLTEAVTQGNAVVQPFVLLGFSDDAALARRCAENYLRRTVAPQPAMAAGRYGHEKIRLAYLSADFHQHPTAQLMAELFERHDRSRFEVTGIAFGPDDGSAMRARLACAFDRFVDVRGLSDLEVARLLRDGQTDIAVDLNGHSLGARPGIFAHRPAPVQVNYLVYPGTIGASFLDYILADRVVLPLDQQAFYAEKIVHLPHSYQANDATRVVGAAPSRAEAGLPPRDFVFCCFNNGWKITAPLFDVWMRLLKGVAGSVLWLLDGPQAANLRRAAAARGIDPARLVFAPSVTPEAHLARQQLADLALDTLPYGAHTTASDALWAGVPLVTCLGRSFPGRVGASLLNALDMLELVTRRIEDYEALALELAKDPALLAATRAKLARNRQTAPLFDTARFVAGIEAAYEAMVNPLSP